MLFDQLAHTRSSTLHSGRIYTICSNDIHILPLLLWCKTHTICSSDTHILQPLLWLFFILRIAGDILFTTIIYIHYMMFYSGTTYNHLTYSYIMDYLFWLYPCYLVTWHIIKYILSVYAEYYLVILSTYLVTTSTLICIMCSIYTINSNQP